jgi:hypothetical protein
LSSETQQVGVYEIDKGYFDGLEVEAIISQIIERAGKSNDGIVRHSMNLTESQFQLVQEIWQREIGEELTPKKAEEYGEKLLALVCAVARARSLGFIKSKSV